LKPNDAIISSAEVALIWVEIAILSSIFAKFYLNNSITELPFLPENDKALT
jgi:hypothetical protein